MLAASRSVQLPLLDENRLVHGNNENNIRLVDHCAIITNARFQFLSIKLDLTHPVMLLFVFPDAWEHGGFACKRAYDGYA